eukprot:13565240-Ditylum_brightwellii.AAC.1
MQKRLLEASELMRFYETVGRKVMVANTVYKTIIKSFLDQWKGLTDCKMHSCSKDHCRIAHHALDGCL